MIDYLKFFAVINQSRPTNFIIIFGSVSKSVVKHF